MILMIFLHSKIFLQLHKYFMYWFLLYYCILWYYFAMSLLYCRTQFVHFIYFVCFVLFCSVFKKRVCLLNFNSIIQLFLFSKIVPLCRNNFFSPRRMVLCHIPDNRLSVCYCCTFQGLLQLLLSVCTNDISIF